MAEVRKFSPGKCSHIAEAIAKAMGESVRPITPGASPDPSQPQPTKTDGPSAISASTFFVSDEFLTASIPPTDEPTE